MSEDGKKKIARPFDAKIKIKSDVLSSLDYKNVSLN